ncbi:unnamed protein product, partial [Meganyctiphanes norvegica]
LRSWRSDLAELNEVAKEHGVLEESPEIKVLGMLWNTNSSTMRLRAEQKWSGKYSRSSILSYANQHYDPLGLIVPVEIRMRLFIQELCSLGLEWEQIFAGHYPELVRQWDTLRAECKIALTKTHPRSVCNSENAVLHVFCDASKSVYGAVAYIVWTDGSCVKSELVKSQAKIVGKDKAPKVDTIPKLELMALLIGSILASYCVKALFHVKISAIYLWGDSKTALSWCSSYDVKEDFVSNRVRQIRNNVPQANLMYIRSEMNPADILTRQPKAEVFLKNTLWWNGPPFLVSPESMPPQTDLFNLMPEEGMKKEFITTDTSIIPSAEEIVSQSKQARPDLILASKAQKKDNNDHILTSMPVGTQLIEDDLASENSFAGFESQNSQNPDFEGFEMQTVQPYVPYVNWEKMGLLS